MKTFFYALFFLVTLSIFTQCKPKKDPKPPCPDALHFKITSELWYGNFEGKSLKEPMEVDTIFTSSVDPITIEANDVGADSYEWQIGLEPNKRRGRKVVLTFGIESQFLPTTIDITLTVKYNDKDECHQNIPNRTQTITKKLTIIEGVIGGNQAQKTNDYLGNFQGYDIENITNLYTIKIYVKDYYNSNSNLYNFNDIGHYNWIDNLSGGIYNVGAVRIVYDGLFKYFAMERCLYPKMLTWADGGSGFMTYANTNYTAVIRENTGWGFTDKKNRNKITIYYQLRHPATGALMPPRTFIGTRVP